MFTQKSFEVFEIAGLEPRMTAIRADIQPIFTEIAEKFLSALTEKLPEKNFYLHIAQHRRRTVYAPHATLCALSENKRGYKMMPHFQLGICGSYVFVYLGVIDNPKQREHYAQKLLEIRDLPSDFVVSKDHMNAEYFPISDYQAAAERLKTVKKADFEVGRIWSAERFKPSENEKILKEMRQTLIDLLPVYEKVMEEE